MVTCLTPCMQQQQQQQQRLQLLFLVEVCWG
jgi:hypothetical protein